MHLGCVVILATVSLSLAWVPTPPAERLVAIAYSTWFPPINWAQCTWGTPFLGRYASADRNVIRQHATWLRDAGVDFIVVDWSNNIDYLPDIGQGLDRTDLAAIESATVPLFEEFLRIPRAPKIAILSGSPRLPDYQALPNGKLKAKADQIYRHFIANTTLAAQYLFLDGHPLLLDYVGTPSPFQTTPSPWRDPRFTMRPLTGFVSEQRSLWQADRQGHRASVHGFWSWEDRDNATFPVVNNHPEAMVITAAVRGDPCGWNCAAKRQGRGAQGETFQSKWAYARAVGPRVAFVQSWNQWSGCPQTPGENMNEQFSTDIEPMAGGHGDLYLKLLASNIAAFKAGR